MRRVGHARPAAPPSGRAAHERTLLEHLHDYANLMLVNLLWLVTSLPLVTLPAATAGLSAVTDAWVRTGRRPDVVQLFFGVARRQFGRATLVALADAVLAAPLVMNLLIVQRATDPGPLLLAARGTCVAGLVFLAAVNLVLWPALSNGDGLAASWRRAVAVVLSRPVQSLLTVAVSGLVVVLGLMLPRFVFLFIGVAAAAYAASWGVSRLERGLPEVLRAGAGTGHLEPSRADLGTGEGVP